MTQPPPPQSCVPGHTGHYWAHQTAVWGTADPAALGYRQHQRGQAGSPAKVAVDEAGPQHAGWVLGCAPPCPWLPSGHIPRLQTRRTG